MPMYFVETAPVINGRREYFWPERDSEDTGKRTVILDLITGQFKGQIVRIVEVDLQDRTADDVTEDMALEVIKSLEDVPLSQDLREFLETQCPEAWRDFCVSKDAREFA